jgi:hypothetical protein
MIRTALIESALAIGIGLFAVGWWWLIRKAHQLVERLERRWFP